jgi:hypothetical protein
MAEIVEIRVRDGRKVSVALTLDTNELSVLANALARYKLQQMRNIRRRKTDKVEVLACAAARVADYQELLDTLEKAWRELQPPALHQSSKGDD